MVSENGKDYIIYTDHELVESVETRTRVTIADEQVSIIRSGGTNTHMIFEAGIRHIIPYETPFGLLEMVSSTKSIDTIKIRPYRTQSPITLKSTIRIWERTYFI